MLTAVKECCNDIETDRIAVLVDKTMRSTARTPWHMYTSYKRTPFPCNSFNNQLPKAQDAPLRKSFFCFYHSHFLQWCSGGEWRRSEFWKCLMKSRVNSFGKDFSRRLFD